MTKKAYNVLEDTYCTYCQREYGNTAKWRAHINRQHEGTYIHAALHEALTAQRIDPGVALAQREVEGGES